MTQPFQFANGQLAHNAEDLLELCKQFPDDGTNYLVREDIEKWLAYIGKEDIAQCATSARQTAQGDRQKLDEFLAKCHALSSPENYRTPEEVAQSDPVVEKPEPTQTIEETTSTDTVPSTSTPTPLPASPSNNSSSKPSFFRTIARLIINIFYRNKN